MRKTKSQAPRKHKISAKGTPCPQGAEVHIPHTVTHTFPPAEPTLEDHCEKTIAKLHETLVARGASYGSFFQNSEMAISIQEILQTTGQDYRIAMHDRAEIQANAPVPLSLIHLLLNATNMIAAKQSRLFATPIHADSWLDIAGYAILAHAAISMKGPK